MGATWPYLGNYAAYNTFDFSLIDMMLTCPLPFMLNTYCSCEDCMIGFLGESRESRVTKAQ